MFLLRVRLNLRLGLWLYRFKVQHSREFGCSKPLKTRTPRLNMTLTGPDWDYQSPLIKLGRSQIKDWDEGFGAFPPASMRSVLERFASMQNNSEMMCLQAPVCNWSHEQTHCDTSTANHPSIRAPPKVAKAHLPLIPKVLNALTLHAGLLLSPICPYIPPYTPNIRVYPPYIPLSPDSSQAAVETEVKPAREEVAKVTASPTCSEVHLSYSYY